MFNLTPSTFSYLNTEARCPICNGRGEINEVDVEKIVTNKNISLLDGAIGFYGKLSNFINNPNANWMKGQVVALALDENVDLSIPWKDLPDGFKHELLYGVDKIVTFPFFNKRNGRTRKIQRKVEGLVPLIKRLFNEATDPKVIDRYFSKKICPSCNNERLNKEGRMVTICNVRYPVASNYTFKEMLEFINEIETEYSEKELNKVRSCISALKEITLCSSKLGIDYLSLGQSTATLSTGESQRIKLLGAYLNHMSHILYIFDEPSKGLDARDYTHVMNMMKALKEENNTIIMVEHNIDMIKLADNIIEIGPKAGKGGGNIIGEGTFEELLKNKNTELSKCNSIKRITSEHDISDMVTYSGLNKNYLKNISISFPRNAITSIYGVSGSGKSTLLRKEIYPRALEDKKFDDCILVDSTPIGKNNKSIIATYVGIMDEIRTLFACTEQAKEANMDEKYFSFNQEEGCCSKCNGDGRIELEFFKDTFIKCPDCDGTRYNDTVLKIKYQNKNINEVLNLSILEALDFFINNNELNTICIKLEFLKKVGLGYLKIGDTTSSLSGGEASRLKLAKELMKGKKKNTLYLLDEPTIGLHFSDIDNLLLVINELAKDNTILAIEHNKQFLMNSDYYIELGPGAGILGGEVVYQGNKNNI